MIFVLQDVGGINTCILLFYTFTQGRAVLTNPPVGQSRIQGAPESKQGGESDDEASKKGQQTQTQGPVHSTGNDPQAAELPWG